MVLGRRLSVYLSVYSCFHSSYLIGAHTASSAEILGASGTVWQGKATTTTTILPQDCEVGSVADGLFHGDSISVRDKCVGEEMQPGGLGLVLKANEGD